MYDLGKDPRVGLTTFAFNELIYYLPHNNAIKSLQKKGHHYPKQREVQIVEMTENICKEMFHFSNSLSKVTTSAQEKYLEQILLENLKKITMHNLDKHGVITEQKLFYLILSLLEVKQNKQKLNNFLMEVHYLLSAERWQKCHSHGQGSCQFTQSVQMALNNQHQQLLLFLERNFEGKSSLFVDLIEALTAKIVQKQSQDQKKPKQEIREEYLSFGKNLLKQQSSAEWIRKTASSLSKKTISNLFQFENQDEQIRVLLGILLGNPLIIEEISRGSWAIYLNLVILYLPKTQTESSECFTQKVQKYLKKCQSNHKEILALSPNQRYLLQLMDNLLNQDKKITFHQLYQEGFNYLSPILANILGLVMMEGKDCVDLLTIFHHADYYEDVMLAFLDNASSMGWNVLVHAVGYMNNMRYIRGFSADQMPLYQNLLSKYLPYELQKSQDMNVTLHDRIRGAIRTIQQRVQDLNSIGLSRLAQNYLNCFFTLQLSPARCQYQLTQEILQLFLLNLQIPSSKNIKWSFHVMKQFLSFYYRNLEFNFEMLEMLEELIEIKKGLLNEKVLMKLDKLFGLVYKVKAIYVIDQLKIEAVSMGEGNMVDQESQCFLVFKKQIEAFNKLFQRKHTKKIPVSFSVEVIKLATYLLQKQRQLQIQEKLNSYNNDKKFLENAQWNKIDSLLNIFKRNLSDYIQQWGQFLKCTKEKPTNLAEGNLNFIKKQLYW